MNDDETTDLATGALAPPTAPDAAETERALRRRLLMRWLSRGVFLMAVGGGAIGLHWLAADWFGVQAAAGVMAGAVLGLLGADIRLSRVHAPETVTEVISQDLARLEQCFAILQKQVTVTIRTSEHAVLETVNRLNRVHHRSAELHQHIVEAVGRSRVLSESSQQEASGNQATVETLSASQQAFAQARQDNQERIRTVVEQVRHLTPLAALIGDISQQTNLLAINASIEAARAGQEGAGFKVVAAEVRRLSAQTAEAADKISRGIQSVADTIEGELAQANELDSDGGAALHLTEVATHIAQISASLNEVVPYLVELSQNMSDGMDSITTDIIDAMGHMQFQDINRQLLEQVESALGSLSEHSASLYALVGGDAPPPPQDLEDLMERWIDGYVTEEQRIAHAAVTEGAVRARPANGKEVVFARSNVTADDIKLPEPEVPKIELF
ncbi:methyl-accepting chemotaxis protein [Aquabacterium sp. A3]|uniref:methyl-accepting chemotaxis protein n=1 Tax=Aquabacterium sp. A3 TaxID=3132829 RepID=UPI0031195F42